MHADIASDVSTKEPFVGINVTSDTQGNYYLDQKDKIRLKIKELETEYARTQKNKATEGHVRSRIARIFLSNFI